LCVIFSLIIYTLGCRRPQKKQELFDTPISGKINISADESFKPVIDEQVKVFESAYPNTTINVQYKPEAECLKDLLNDSATRLVIVTRGLNYKEEKYFSDSMGYVPQYDRIATDAVAVVVNSNNTDTFFSVKRLQDQLSGKLGNKQQVVFDGLSATSTVRFAIDSILKGKVFDTGVVKAVRSSQDVLKYVASDVNAIGLVGISWIGNPEDTAQLNMLNKVKIAYVRCDQCVDSPYVKPNQMGILTKRYPLIRGLYYILKENYNGLGMGFVNFMRFERGQLIFKRAYLGSSKIGFGLRSVKINEKLVK
jgi:phosphate transport system substrate-binding protein